MNTISTTKALCLAVFCAAITGNVGCAKMSWKPSEMFSLDSTWPFADKDKPHEGVPVRMVATWSDTVLSQAGQKPQRGFGGRVMFYEKDETKPILVDGQFIVYTFDESDRDPTDNKPTRRYVFPAEQMPLHMSKSDLGASYSFWLPWDEAGGPKTDVSLICRFEPKGGAVVTSEQTRHRLPGSTPALVTNGQKKPPKLPDGVPSKPVVQSLQSLQNQRAAEQSVKLANYEAPVTADSGVKTALATQDAGAAPNKRLSAMTITLPANYQLPSAGTLANQTSPVAGTSQLPAQQHQQQLPTQQFQQQTPAFYPPAAQPALNPVGMTTPTMQLPVATPFGVNINQQPALQASASYLPPGGAQATFPPQTAQQSALQQQMLMQQMIQQQGLQQRAIQSQAIVQQNGQQTPVQNVNQATVTYQPVGQYLR